MEQNVQVKKSPYKGLILIISIALPVVVAFMYLGPKFNTSYDLTILPAINAAINGSTFLTLIMALVAIKKGNVTKHKKLMKIALSLSVLFLLFYVLYHSSTEATRYGGEGAVKYIYFFLLITHIVLAAAIVPLVLITYVRALSERFDKHKKIARIALPLWLYVSLTGVIVYFMIAPYYL